MEIDKRQYIKAEHSSVPEHRPFVVTDLANSIAHRRMLEQTALDERVRGVLGFGENNLIINLGAWESAQAIVVQRSIIDGESMEPDEISLILTSVDWKSLLGKLGKTMSDSEFNEAKLFVLDLLPPIVKITESFRENPGRLLFRN